MTNVTLPDTSDVAISTRYFFFFFIYNNIEKVSPVEYNPETSSLSKEDNNEFISSPDKEIMTDANNLYEGCYNAAKGSKWKEQTQYFLHNKLVNVARIQEELQRDGYVVGKRNEFTLSERGKTRLIRSASMKDKTIQHVLCDRILIPILRDIVIYDNYASLEGRGVSMALNRLKYNLINYYNKYKTNEGYIMLMDFSSYYDNVMHDYLKEFLLKYIHDEYTIHLMNLFIDSFKQDVSFLSDVEYLKVLEGKFKALDYINIPNELRTGEKMLPKSLNLGDQCSQIFGISFTTFIDNYIKIVCQEPYYAKYMDDSYIISPDKYKLMMYRDDIIDLAKTQGVILNKDKTQIFKLSHDFKFLQTHHFITETGKIVIKIDSQKIVRMRKRIKALKEICIREQLPKELIIDMFNSWKGSYYHICSKDQRNELDLLMYNTINELQEIETKRLIGGIY